MRKSEREMNTSGDKNVIRINEKGRFKRNFSS